MSEKTENPNLPTVDEKARKTGDEMAQVLLAEFPELRSVSIVLDWKIESEDLPTGIYRARDQELVTVVRAIRQVSKFAAQLVSIWNRTMEKVIGGKKDGGESQGKDQAVQGGGNDQG